MKKTDFIVVVIVTILIFVGFAYGGRKESDQKLKRMYELIGDGVIIPDGNTWLKLSITEKINFVAGFMAGVTILTLNAQWDAMVVTLYPKKQMFAKFMLEQSIVNTFELSNITFEQLYEGLEAFYRDYRNRSIEIVNAVYVVRAEIRGEDPGYIEAQIRWLRKPRKQRDMTKSAKEFLDKGKKGPELGTYRGKNGKDYVFFDHIPLLLRK